MTNSAVEREGSCLTAEYHCLDLCSLFLSALCVKFWYVLQYIGFYLKFFKKRSNFLVLYGNFYDLYSK